MPLRPPVHRATAPAVLISKQDSAWDSDRLDREVTALVGEGDEADPEKALEHPYIRYHQGEGRYDLDARMKWSGGVNCARDYLVREPDAKFVLRLMDVDAMAELGDALKRERGKDDMAFQAILARAARMGLDDIEGPGWKRTFDSRGQISAETMRAIYDAGGEELIGEIGWAAYGYSKPLSEQEKKASGSGPGPGSE